ncbi:MAG: hypothetical protein V3T29_02995 [Alphaproteobacteria bacterium]
MSTTTPASTNFATFNAALRWVTLDLLRAGDRDNRLLESQVDKTKQEG